MKPNISLCANPIVPNELCCYEYAPVKSAGAYEITTEHVHCNQGISIPTDSGVDALVRPYLVK